MAFPRTTELIPQSIPLLPRPSPDQIIPFGLITPLTIHMLHLLPQKYGKKMLSTLKWPNLALSPHPIPHFSYAQGRKSRGAGKFKAKLRPITDPTYTEICSLLRIVGYLTRAQQKWK